MSRARRSRIQIRLQIGTAGAPGPAPDVRTWGRGGTEVAFLGRYRPGFGSIADIAEKPHLARSVVSTTLAEKQVGSNGGWAAGGRAGRGTNFPSDRPKSRRWRAAPAPSSHGCASGSSLPAPKNGWSFRSMSAPPQRWSAVPRRRSARPRPRAGCPMPEEGSRHRPPHRIFAGRGQPDARALRHPAASCAARSGDWSWPCRTSRAVSASQRWSCHLAQYLALKG